MVRMLYWESNKPTRLWREITEYLWKNCYEANLVKSEIHIINRENRKTVYSFQTLTLPYFTALHSE